jgi:hypothetical protein
MGRTRRDGPARLAQRSRSHKARPHEAPAGTRDGALGKALVRIAEHMAGDTSAPALNSDAHAIAVYDIPAPKQGSLAGPLKGAASLRRYQKKDIKPSRVEILRHDDETATSVYLFPRSVEITKRGGGIEFAAQIGRL